MSIKHRLKKLELNTRDNKIDIISYGVKTINNKKLKSNQYKRDGYIFTNIK